MNEPTSIRRLCDLGGPRVLRVLAVSPWRSVFDLTAAMMILATATLNAQWPQWRGPNRDGVVPAASVPAAWPKAPTLQWKQTIVLNRNPEKYDEVRRYKVASAPTWAQPVVLGTAVVVRDADSVTLWSLK